LEQQPTTQTPKDEIPAVPPLPPGIAPYVPLFPHAPLLQAIQILNGAPEVDIGKAKRRGVKLASAGLGFVGFFGGIVPSLMLMDHLLRFAPNELKIPAALAVSFGLSCLVYRARCHRLIRGLRRSTTEVYSARKFISSSVFKGDYTAQKDGKDAVFINPANGQNIGKVTNYRYLFDFLPITSPLITLKRRQAKTRPASPEELPRASSAPTGAETLLRPGGNTSETAPQTLPRPANPPTL